MRGLTLLALAVAVPASAQIQPLGQLPPGGNLSSAVAASADGRLVVGAATDNGFTSATGFRWTAATGLASLGPAPGYPRVGPSSLSASGSAACGGASGAGLPDRAAVWAGTWSLLALPAGSTHSGGCLLSSDGSTATGLAGVEGFQARTPYRATPGGGATPLPVPAGYVVSEAGLAGLSADGSVIVGTVEDASGSGLLPSAVRWDGQTAARLETPAGSASSAAAVSGDGTTVVGTLSTALSGGGTRLEGARWTASGLQRLGPLTGGAEFVSTDGSVVVGPVRGGFDVYRWTAAGGVLRIEPPVGWTFVRAGGLSADGRVVVGHGFSTQDGAHHAFVWTEAEGVVDLGATPGVGTGTFDVAGVSADGSLAFGVFENMASQFEAFVVPARPALVLRPIVSPDVLAVPGTQQVLPYRIEGVPSARLALVLDRRPPPPPALPDSLIVLAEGLPASPGGFVQWSVPDDVLTTHARLALIDTTGTEPRIGYSARFRIRPLVLARVRADSTYQVFDPLQHGYAFGNVEAQLFPPAWFGLPFFDYSGGVDPFLASGGYPFWMSLPLVSAAPADFPDWPSYARVFNPDSVYADGSLPLREALRWQDGAREAWAGSCYGMSQTALMVFADPARVAATFPGVGRIDDDLFLAIPFLSHPTLPGNPAARIAINQIHTWQQGAERRLNTDNLRLRAPGVTLFDLQQMFQSDDLSTYRALSLYEHDGTPGSGGHTVLPLEVRPDGDTGRFLVFIYDPNLPGEQNQRIVIDPVANRWVYDEPTIDADDGRWEGSNLLYVEPPVRDLFAPATRPAVARGARGGAVLTVSATPGAAVALTNPQGQTVGFAGDTITDAMPGAVPLVPSVGGPSVPVGYAVPADAYRLSLAGAPGGAARAVFDPAGGDLYGFERTGAAPADTDRLAYDGGSLRAVNPDATAREVTLFALRSGATDERFLSAEALGISAADSVAVAVVGDAALSLRSFAAPTTYRLRLLRRQGATTAEFVAPGVALAAGATHTAVPTWTDLATVRLDIDTNSDGTIDETRTLANTVAGGPAPEAPPALALSVGPNPSAGAVTVRVALPEAGPVRVSVVDLLGRTVAVLAEGPVAAGVHALALDGARLAAGVYTVRLVAGSDVRVQRLTVVR